MGANHSQFSLPHPATWPGEWELFATKSERLQADVVVELVVPARGLASLRGFHVDEAAVLKQVVQLTELGHEATVSVDFLILTKRTVNDREQVSRVVLTTLALSDLRAVSDQLELSLYPILEGDVLSFEGGNRVFVEKP